MTTLAATSAGLPKAHGRWIIIALFLLALWAWAIAGCADEWTNDPMYSYGWFVPPLMLFFAWRRLDEPIAGRVLFGDHQLPNAPRTFAIVVTALALFVLPIELFRNELPDDRLNNWGLGLCAVGATLWVAYCIGGWKLVRTLGFPIAFFLAAVAWPKRYESPVTVGLQKFVAAIIVEVMHIMGIHAEPHGTTIYLRNGPVGIAEACSGIRSLQASLMISLAVGELFFLRLGRRILLVLLCASVATVLNIGRTLALCLITEYQGADAMHKAHDLIGDAILLVLPLLAWGLGRLLVAGDGGFPTDPLPRKPGADGTPPPISHWKRLGLHARSLPWQRMPNLAPALVVGVAGILTYHVWLAILDRRSPPQVEPYFSIQTSEGSMLEKLETNPDIWAALSPSDGGTYRVKTSQPQRQGISLYHFFWKPAAANRWVTGHRPDICMPAGGWKKDGEVEPLDVDFAGQSLRMHLFRFADAHQRAIQVWGIWRNGEPIHMDFFESHALEWSLLTGKSRSAVEVVSCVIPYTDGPPPIEEARRVLTAAVQYRRPPTASSASTSAAAPASTAP